MSKDRECGRAPKLDCKPRQSIRLDLKAVSCQTRNPFAEEQVQVEKKEDVLPALSEMSTKLRRKIGESLSSIEKYDVPFVRVTTPSIEALQAFTLGARNRDSAAQVSYFQEAIRLDPNFATAYLGLGNAYADLGDDKLAAENIRKAYELRERASEREKLRIESMYFWSVTGDLKKSRQVNELSTRLYPRELAPLGDLAGIDFSLGQYERSVSEFEEIHRRKPTDDFTYYPLVAGNLALGRIKEANAIAEEALAKGFDFPFLRFTLYDLAFVRGDEAKMQQQVAWSTGKPGVENVLVEKEAFTAAYYGKLSKAREYHRRTVNSAVHSTEKETVARHMGNWANLEALFGNARDAREKADSALRFSKGRGVQLWVAQALAYSGDTSRAKAIADHLAREFPEDTLVQSIELPFILAQLALNQKDHSKAIACR
jgi:eukaryotic-like serine/threonine-protein kinase